MADRRRPTEERRTELVDAALHIIATRGIAQLTTHRLAAHVGLSDGAIFRHFATLDALLDAVVTRFETVLASTYPPKELPPLERLSRFIDARSAAVGDRIGLLRLVVSEQFHLALPKQGTARIAACAKQSREFVLACIREGQAEGAIRDDADAGALAVVVMGTIQALAIASADARHRPAPPDAVREALVRLLAPAAAPSAKAAGKKTEKKRRPA